jgi:hypothetical protein
MFQIIRRACFGVEFDDLIADRRAGDAIALS